MGRRRGGGESENHKHQCECCEERAPSANLGLQNSKEENVRAVLQRKVEQLVNLVKMAGLREVQQGLNEVQRCPERVEDSHT